MIDETTKAPVGDGDDEPKTEGEGEPASDTPSRDSSGNLDISKKSVSKKCMWFFLINWTEEWRKREWKREGKGRLKKRMKENEKEVWEGKKSENES